MKTIGISMPTGMENDAIREREERSEEESKSITIDENGIRSEVVYEEGKQTYKTGSGEVGSPEQIREAEYYKYGGIPKSITYGDVKNEYVYDAKCRISKLKCGEETYNYVYDDRDRVISVDKSGEKLVEYTYRGSDVSGVKTGNVNRSFTYDVKGRITEVKKSINGGAYTEEMTAEYLGDAKDTVKITSGGAVTTTRRGSGKVLNEYESEDELLKMSAKAYVDEASDGAVTSSSVVSYNGNAVTYDSIGNPLSYMGKTFTWEGRRLKSVTSGESTLDFAYNYEGMRTKKGNVRYFYVGNRLVSEVRDNVTILYRYGVKGLSSIVVKKGEDTQKYVCRTNIFGDVIAIYNTEGDLQCKYNYDAWGNHRIGNARNELIYDSATGIIATGYEDHIAILNPIRYRGYYYDNETRLYYLQSRYYDATLCRFLNRDNVEYLSPNSINGLNLYCYCGNDPINRFDPSGHFWDYVFDAAFIAWGIYDLVNGGYKDWENWVALGVDIVFAVLPFVPSGAGQVIKVGNKIDSAVDVASAG